MPIQKVTPAVHSSAGERADAPTPQMKNKSGRVAVPILAVVTLVALSGCAFMFIKYRIAQRQINSLSSPQEQQELAKKEVQSLVAKIGKLIILPTDEEPTVATVTDADALKSEQPFYKDAVNGNKVVIYMQAKKAVIFDETKNILVNVGPIFVDEAVSSTQAVAGDKITD